MRDILLFSLPVILPSEGKSSSSGNGANASFGTITDYASNNVPAYSYNYLYGVYMEIEGAARYVEGIGHDATRGRWQMFPVQKDGQ
jgi:hypothetical protein